MNEDFEKIFQLEEFCKMMGFGFNGGFGTKQIYKGSKKGGMVDLTYIGINRIVKEQGRIHESICRLGWAGAVTKAKIPYWP